MKNTRLTHLLAPALLLGLVFFSCKKPAVEKPAAPPVPASADVRVVATVNGEPITLAEFQERYSRSGLKPDPEAALEVKREFLNRLIDRMMMLREAQRKRIKIAPQNITARIDAICAEEGKDVKDILSDIGLEFEKWKSDVWEDMMIERLVARDVNSHVSVAQAEIRRYYEANRQEFDKPDQVRARQIVVETEQEAIKVREQLLAPGADFAAVARQTSKAPEAGKGGDLGFFAKGEMPAEFNVVFDLPKGGISGIIKSPYGYHIFKLEDMRKAGMISIADASREITDRLRHDKQDVRYKQWLKELRARTKFEVNYQALEQ
ncbi:MAG TPA: peptidyl-prolyl cis-trans isomerase [Nitrospirota bacterium]|nr:peptidyl-prolyl cis-trans isomerase [Nitrospirota bacterium]